MEDHNPENLNNYWYLRSTIAVIIILVSLFALVSAYYNNYQLTSLSNRWINLKVNTAICFLSTGLILLFINKPKRSSVTDVFLLSLTALVTLISSLTFLEYLAGLNFGIDELILKDPIPLFHKDPYPGRMTFSTSLGFLLTSFSFLISLRKSETVWITQFVIWIVLLLSLVSMFNYIYGINPFSLYAKYTTMAVLTMALFILASINILLFKPDSGIIGIMTRKNNSGYLLRRIIPINIILPIALIQLGFYLELNKLIDLFTVIIMFQVGLFVIAGVVIASTAYILDRKEKDLKKFQEQVLLNEKILHQFADNIEIVLFTAAPDLGKILYVSPAYEKIWGKSRDSLYINAKDWFDAIISDDKKNVHEIIFEGIQQEKINPSTEFRILRPDNSIRTIYCRFYRVEDQLNNIFVSVGIAMDITEVTWEKIYKQIHFDLLQLIEKELNLTDFFHKTLKLMGISLSLEFSELWLVDEPNSVLRYSDVWHRGSKFLYDFETKSYTISFKSGEGFPGKIWELQRPFFVPNYSNNPAFSRADDAKKAGISSAFGIPLIFKNKVYGVMAFFSNDLRTQDTAFVNFLEHISKTIGEYIVHAELISHMNKLSRLDFLTGLLTRSALEDDLDKQIIEGGAKTIIVMVLDIDRFKLINECFGHELGDHLLKLVATRLKESIKHNIQSIARLGADKFILCFLEESKQNVFEQARTLSNKLKNPFEIDNNKINLTVSIGISIYPKDSFDGKSLVIYADLAMTQAKEKGGNRIYFFTNDLPLLISNKVTMDLDLRQALTCSDQLILVYQPQLDLQTGTICAAEVLVRWQHPKKGLIGPNEFISFAEQNNLIIALNEHILRKAFQQINSSPLDIPISINISAQQLEDGFRLVEYLEALMKEFLINSKQVELEITENMLVEDTDHNISVLSALQELGFTIAIDDFGSGFSSFNYLTRLPINKIKIDKAFISGLPDNSANVKIVQSIIALAHSLNKITIAEGVEKKAEVTFLSKEHCDMVQGYYYYRPITFKELQALLIKSDSRPTKKRLAIIKRH